ncbi:hypothetical protein DdX_21489 [Ditylenchus destructor]|uniref:Glutaredoxin domain-containing protein n=1 Tax=Ditylenchus destructor TaxID=166010 RepID=A0AAD4QV83_9BILA|nr:hypothetical protein DdX_21489 [Ditylenchus destructor]
MVRIIEQHWKFICVLSAPSFIQQPVLKRAQIVEFKRKFTQNILLVLFEFDTNLMRTVPQVFIGGKFLGGGDDSKKGKKDGSLEKKLEEVGALWKPNKME